MFSREAPVTTIQVLIAIAVAFFWCERSRSDETLDRIAQADGWLDARRPDLALQVLSTLERDLGASPELQRHKQYCAALIAAGVALQNSDGDAALTALAALEPPLSERAMVYWFKSRAYRQKGDPEEARRHLKQARKLRRDAPWLKPESR